LTRVIFYLFMSAAFIGLAVAAVSPSVAQLACDDGGPANDVIVCDTSPADGMVTGGDGADDVTVTDAVDDPVDVTGDGIETTDDALIGGDDTVTMDGTAGGVQGDDLSTRSSSGDAIAVGGNDAIDVNGSAEEVAGDSASGVVDAGPGASTVIGGSDTIEVDGSVGGSITGDSLDGSSPEGDTIVVGGNDTMTIGGSVGEDVTGDNIAVASDFGLTIGAGGADNLTIAGDVSGDVVGDGVEAATDSGLVIATGGDDTITVSGNVEGSVYGDGVSAESTSGDAAALGGHDTIVISGNVGGDVMADGLAVASESGQAILQGGNDTVRIEEGAIVGGVIDGESGEDRLEFAFLTPEDVVGLLAAEGSYTHENQTYTWQNFEELLGLAPLPDLEPEAPPTEEAPDDDPEEARSFVDWQRADVDCANMRGVVTEYGIVVANDHGLVALITNAELQTLIAGEEGLTVEAVQGDGWSIAVRMVATLPDGQSVFRAELLAGGEVACGPVIVTLAM
jgi:hypothetical protein